MPKVERGFEVNVFDLDGLKKQIKREENSNSLNPNERGLPQVQFNAQAFEMAVCWCPTRYGYRSFTMYAHCF
jgi:hypothetical protein